MKKQFIALWFFTQTLNLFGAVNLDSLRNLSFLKDESIRLDALIKIAAYYQDNLLDSALFYYQKSMEQALLSKNYYKQAEIHKFLGNVLFKKGNFIGAEKEYTNSFNQFLSLDQPIEQAKVLNNLGLLYQNLGKNKEAVAYLEKAYKTYQTAQDEILLTGPLINLGNLFFRTGEYKNAADKFLLALLLAKKQNNIQIVANTYNNLGAVYKEWGKYVDALQAYEQALLIYININDKYAEAITNYNLGVLYEELGKYDKAIQFVHLSYQQKMQIKALDKAQINLIKLGDIYCTWRKYDLALDYYNEALQLSKENENPYNQASSLSGIAKVFIETDIYPKAIDLLTQAMLIFENIQSKKEIAQINNDLGFIYSQKLHDYKKAESFFKKAESIAIELDSEYDLSNIKYQMGLNLMEQNRIREAIECFEKSKDLALTNNFQLYNNYFCLAECYKKNSQLNESVDAYQKALQYKDSVFEQKAGIQLAHYQVQYQLQKKETEIEKLKQLNEWNTLQLNKNKTMHLLFISITAALLIFVVIILFIAMKLKKINAQLQLQQSKIENQKQDLQDTNLKLIEARIQAEKLSDFKSQFLANISHEIRTPLNAIIGYTKLLGKNVNAENNHQYLNNIIQSSNNLSVIINDLLDFSKIEAGKMILDHTVFHPFEIITQAISTLKYKAEEKNITLEIHIDPMIPRVLKGDPYRLSQIMINLLSNALKFSHQNQVVTVEVYAQINQSNCLLSFLVKDHGIGIESDKLESIFESFNQAQTDTARLYGGAGLGLAIVKRLVTLQKGTIEVKSKINEGSTFTVHINYEIPPVKVQQENLINTKVENLFPLQNDEQLFRILLVEDNLINQELAKDTINSWNGPFMVDIAENGREAIEALKNNTYHVIIMDIQMPIMDGHEATRFIRNDMPEPISKIPIIGMTAHAMTSEKELALKNGMNEYIIKPFNPEELKQKIIYFVNK